MGNLVSGCGAVELIAQLDRRQSRQDPGDPQLRSARPGDASSTWYCKSPRPTRNPTFVNTNLTPNGQAAALVIRGCPAEPAVQPDREALGRRGDCEESSMRRVVVTGMGMVTPVGRDLESTWSALLPARAAWARSRSSTRGRSRRALPPRSRISGSTTTSTTPRAGSSTRATASSPWPPRPWR